MAKKLNKRTIGRSEYLDLPDWGIRKILAKVDTGARTSALHVEDLEELPEDQVLFHVIVDQGKIHRRVEVVSDVVKWAKVRSSTGHYSVRCFVRTLAKIGDVEKEIEISLVSREKMNYRMLLGRQALARDFVVDVSKLHALGGQKRKGSTRKKS